MEYIVNGYQDDHLKKENITIVQKDNEEPQNVVTQLREFLEEITESINLAEIQNVLDDKIKERQNAYNTIESVGTKSKEIVDDD